MAERAADEVLAPPDVIRAPHDVVANPALLEQQLSIGGRVLVGAQGVQIADAFAALDVDLAAASPGALVVVSGRWNGHELVDARNKADNMIHAVRKSVADLGDKVSAEEKAAVDKAVDELQAAMKGDDKADIEAKTNALTQASAKIAERAYAQAQQASGAAETDAASAAGSGSPQDNVVDAEFEEVKEDRRKS